MGKIIKIVDMLEADTKTLSGELIVHVGIENQILLDYIEKRLENTEKNVEFNGKKLSKENEKSFLLKLRERIKNGR